MRAIPIFAVALTVAGLSACAIPDNARSGLRPVGEKNGVLAFSEGPLAGPANERVMFADPSQREEYALFKSGGKIAEIVYITTRDLHQSSLHLDSAVTSDKLIRRWNYTKTAKLSTVDSFWFDAGWVGMWVKPFTLSATRQSCAGFVSEWDKPADDVDQLPSKTLFGYFCESPDVTLSLADMKKRLTEVGVRGINIKLPGGDEPDAARIVEVPAIPEIPSQSTLMSGVRQGPYGTPDFPYGLARVYGVSKGCDSDGNC